MIEKKDDGIVKVAISPETGEAQGDEAVANQGMTEDAMPLEEMSKAQLIEKIETLQEQVEKNYDLYVRSQAEMENFKKRTAKEKEDTVRYANETLIKEILPVIDNLEKAISHAHQDNAVAALREGIELTLKGLKASLKKAGLEEVEAQGNNFDPCFHEAVSEMVDERAKPGTVLQELQKGYVLNGRLIRPSMVVVSKRKDTKASDGNSMSREACEEH
jgi:molecular chaperone GrpE